MLLTEASNRLAATGKAIELKPGPEWASFEQFRMGGALGLEGVGQGGVGTLRTKSSVYRILGDADFQSLVGLASEVDRLRSGFLTMIHAVKVVKENPHSSSAVELLLHIATQCVGSPILPAREGHADHALEDIALLPDDEVIMDAAQLREHESSR